MYAELLHRVYLKSGKDISRTTSSCVTFIHLVTWPTCFAKTKGIKLIPGVLANGNHHRSKWYLKFKFQNWVQICQICYLWLNKVRHNFNPGASSYHHLSFFPNCTLKNTLTMATLTAYIFAMRCYIFMNFKGIQFIEMASGAKLCFNLQPLISHSARLSLA